MNRGIKKPRVRMKSINCDRSQKLSGFFDYLTQPGQMPGEVLPEVYSNIDDSTAAGIKQFLDQYEANFTNAIKEKRLRHNSKLLAKSMVFVLPHEMTKKEVNGYVKAIVKALPEGMTYAFALHRGSHKKTADSWKNLHLQGFLGVRGDGGGKFGADVRLPLHEDIIKASDAYIKSLGFRIKYEPTVTRPSKKSLAFLEAEAMKDAITEGIKGNRNIKSRQSELLRDPIWLTTFSRRDEVLSETLKRFCAEQALKRVGITAEKFEKKPDLNLSFIPKKLNALQKKAAAQKVAEVIAPENPPPSKMVTIKLPMPERLREGYVSRAEFIAQRRLERQTASKPAPEMQPLTKVMLNATLEKAKTNKQSTMKKRAI